MLPLAIYCTHLETLNGIKFTPREIDIVACILNGRSAKTIPSLLSIAPKTVAAHMDNIRSKAGCSSRESIIDFVEKSEKCALIKNEYYLSLLTQNSFEKCLRELFKTVSPLSTICSLIYEQEDKIKCTLIHQLKQHLTLAGFKVECRTKKGQKSLEQLIGERDSPQEKYVLYALSDVDQLHEDNSESVGKGAFIQQTAQHSDRLIFLSLSNKYSDENIKLLDSIKYVNFSEKENYYFSFFELLRIICPHKGLDKIYNGFNQQFQLNHPISKNSYMYPPLKSHLADEEELVRKNHSYLAPIFLIKKMAYVLIGMVFLCGIFFAYHLLNKEKKLAEGSKNETIKEVHIVRSDLVIPTASSFLNRSELFTQIENKLKGEKGLQSLALVGIGGAGKTTLARQYAQQQKATVVWELNAETRDDLNRSFEKLATALSRTDIDKRELRAIQDTKAPQEREERLIQFVKTRLKAISSWLLIFDNVEALANIQNHFPQDTHTWGEGKIILTTRDHNFQNSNQINQVLFIGELNQAEKLNLFTKIMGHGVINPFTPAQREEASQFLDHIPPFPLDVSVAAYYLKSSNSTYSEYLGHIEKHKENFERFQTDILNENGGYSKTRYGIITLSLKKIIAKSKDFSDLLSFISLIHPQNIHRDLLEKYKDPIVVADFIYHLNKYSLIVNNSICSSHILSSLSLHRSTQDISLSYLIQQLALSKESLLIDNIANTLDDYVDQAIEQENFLKMKVMAGHLESFLTHPELLTDLSKGLLKSKLGSIYYFINNDKPKNLIDESLNILKNKSLESLSSADRLRLARSFLHIGAVYTELRLDKEAEEILKKAVQLYRKEGAKNYAGLAWALSYLGNAYRRIGNYEQAKDCLEESLHLNKYYGGDPKHTARTLAYLGFIYRKLGLHQKAIKSFEESLEFYNKNFPNDYFRIGWSFIQLGKVYSELGENKIAKEYLENGLLIFKKHLPEDHSSMGLVLAYLGNDYRQLREYEKSRHYLELSLQTYRKRSSESHIRMGWVMFNLASTYKALGSDEKALKLFDKVIEIYSKNTEKENILTSNLLRVMAEIYFEKNRLDIAENLIKRSLKILQERKHVDVYKSLEILGEIYFKKSFLSLENVQEGQKWKNQAINIFNQALRVTEENFPRTSVHNQRLLSKIKRAQQK